jgi:alpha-tubulin suppressor-like RCC1 family protein
VAVAADTNDVYSWGWNKYGQCGTGADGGVNLPHGLEVKNELSTDVEVDMEGYEKNSDVKTGIKRNFNDSFSFNCADDGNSDKTADDARSSSIDDSNSDRLDVHTRQEALSEPRRMSELDDPSLVGDHRIRYA